MLVGWLVDRSNGNTRTPLSYAGLKSRELILNIYALSGCATVVLEYGDMGEYGIWDMGIWKYGI